MTLPNKKYWIQRSEQRLAAVERGTEKYLEETQRLFDEASRRINADIERIVGNFAKNADITFDEARKILKEPLPDLDLEYLKKQAMAIEDGKERARAMLQVNAPAYRARISRLEGIRLSAKIQLDKLAPEQTRLTKDALIKAADESYYRTVFDQQQGTGFGYSFNRVTDNQIEEVLKQNWSGAHYSKRIWNNTDVLAERVKNTIQQNMVTGRSWKRSLDDVTDLSKRGGQYSAQRLLQTETAYVANEMEAQAYEDADLEKYEFVATLDSKTSQVCQEMDGKKILLKNRKPGINYPPLHAHCRSTTIAVIDGLDVSKLQRRARDPVTGKNKLVPADTDYKEWKKNFNTEQKQAFNLNTKTSSNVENDVVLFDKYKHIYGEEVGNTIIDFQKLKYKNIEKWKTLVKGKQNRLNNMTIEQTKSLIGKLGDFETRSWYKTQVEKIPDHLNDIITFEEKAKKASELRNEIRTHARKLMKNTEKRMILDENRPNKTFEELVIDKMKRKNMTRTEALYDIIKTATETNSIVNNKFGL